jgi:hypothetical protein
MDPTVHNAKNKQLKRLLQAPPTSGRVQEVWRLAKELNLGPSTKAKIAVWVRRGPAKED